MYIKTTGLILREVEYKESSRILTIFAASEGKITVSARGAKRRGSKIAAATQLLSYTDMTLFHERGRYVLTEARSLELFRGLRDDLVLLALGSYFAELLETLSGENLPDPDVLSLGLNALFALSEAKRPPELVKAAFELRLMCLSGLEPQLYGCAICGKDEPVCPALSLTGGILHCLSCQTEGKSVSLSQGALDAMRYIANTEMKKLCSFSVGEETQKQLLDVCESYLLAQTGRGFQTLDFYHSLI